VISGIHAALGILRAATSEVPKSAAGRCRLRTPPKPVSNAPAGSLTSPLVQIRRGVGTRSNSKRRAVCSHRVSDQRGRPHRECLGGAELREHGEAVVDSWSERWLERRIERKGLRARDAAYVIGAFWAIAVVVFGVVERLVDPKTFHNVWLGMWWTVETVTTVGYGDIVPGQSAGKIIACFLMLGGLSLISVVTAAITSGFVSRAEARRRAAGEDPVMQKLEEMAAELREVKAELGHLRPETGAESSC
jgi:voltage-gated potassium channel